MKPIFKEKGKEQFVYKDGQWIKCNEMTISSLWHRWVSGNMGMTYREYDEDGFLVFGIKEDTQ